MSDENPSLEVPNLNGSDEPTLSDAAQSMIANIPEEHRELVSQYVPEWDKQVTQEFQKRADQIRGYTDLGELDYVRGAVEFFSGAQQSPHDFYRDLTQYLVDNLEGFDPMSLINPGESDGTPTELPEFEGVPEEFVKMVTAQNEQMTNMGETLNQFMAQQEEQTHAQVLDNVLGEMHTEHGDFDDRFMLQELAEHGDPNRAIENWNSHVQSIIDSRTNTPPPPKILSSTTAGTPLDQVDKTKLNDSDARKALGVEYLKQQIGQGG